MSANKSKNRRKKYMSKKQFKAESKRLLDLVVNSIYTHNEIFLRELISNASDAIDKLYYKSLTENLGLTRGSFEITLTPDKTARTLTISDNGIGMTAQELEDNLGVIAQSGSLQFKKDSAESENLEDINVIGQFGVGFYSAFIVSNKVTVTSKAYGADNASVWSSEGADGYELTDGERENPGTDIVLYLKEDTEDDNYSEYLEEYKLKELIRKYSDYIRYPIKMPVTKHEHETDENGEEQHIDKVEIETLNSMIPLWKKNKSELKDEDYIEFYKEKFRDYTNPLAWIHSKTEGAATYNALMFIPENAPYNYYSKEYEKGLQLYSSGVMIMERCADLLPDYFSFVRGLVDSEDLSLNISREMLQHDRQLKVIAKAIERSIKNELLKIQQNDREKYEKFWKAFGNQIKFGIYNGFGMNKDTLKDLLMFVSSKDEKTVTLAEYTERMAEGQTVIYFASGSSIQRIKSLPQVENVLDKGYEVLYLTENVDEFCLQIMAEYNEKKFQSVQSADLDLETEEEKDRIKQKNEADKDLLTLMKEALGGKVSDVRFSAKLKTQPACITNSGFVSVEMERILGQMPGGDDSAKAQKVLEINASHPVAAKLDEVFNADKDKLNAYAEILYGTAMLLEGATMEDPAAFVAKVSELMM
jgi:molecular chaperone HtpG